MTVHPPGGAATMFESLTVVTLVLIALAAVIVIGAMVYGTRLSRERRRVQEIEERRAEDYEKAHPDTPPAAPPPPPPVIEAAPEPTPVAAPVPAPEPQPEAVIPPPEPAPAAPEPVTPDVVEAPEPAPLAPPPPAEPEPAPPPPIVDDRPITTIKGVGPKVAGLLAELGVERIGQLAALTPAEAEAIDARLGAFTGRMKRDRWIEQAHLLAAGDTAAYEAQFGKLG